MKIDNRFTRFSIFITVCWLSIFVLSSTAIVFGISFLQSSNTDFFQWQITLQNYAHLIDPIYLTIFLRSLWMAGLCTLICLVLGYPFAYLIANASKSQQRLLLIFLIIPFWTSSLIRSYAIMALLKAHGLVNSILIGLGLIEQPLSLLFSNTAVMIGLVYNLLPFMIFPIYTSLARMDKHLIAAASDLGANHWQILKEIVIPLSKPGMIAGILLVFLPAMTLFYIPDLLGGAKSMLLGNLIQFQFLTIFDWPAGAATSVMLTALLGILILFYQRQVKRNAQ